MVPVWKKEESKEEEKQEITQKKTPKSRTIKGTINRLRVSARKSFRSLWSESEKPKPDELENLADYAGRVRPPKKIRWERPKIEEEPVVDLRMPSHVARLPEKNQKIFKETRPPMGMSRKAIELWMWKIFEHKKDEKEREKEKSARLFILLEGNVGTRLKDGEIDTSPERSEEEGPPRLRLEKEVHGYLFAIAEKIRDLDRKRVNLEKRGMDKEEKESLKKRLQKQISNLSKIYVLKKRYLRACKNLIYSASNQTGAELKHIEIQEDHIGQQIKLVNEKQTNTLQKSSHLGSGKMVAQTLKDIINAPRFMAWLGTAGTAIFGALYQAKEKILKVLEIASRNKEILEPILVIIGAITGAFILGSSLTYLFVRSINAQFEKKNREVLEKKLKEYEEETTELYQAREAMAEKEKKIIVKHIGFAKKELDKIFRKYKSKVCKIDDPTVYETL